MATEAQDAAHDDEKSLRSAGQEDARALEHQAAHDKHPQKAVKGAEGKLAKHRDLIVVSLTLVGIVIGYLSFRQAKNANDDSSSSDTSSGDTTATDDNGDLLDGYTSGGTSGYVLGGGSTSAGDTGTDASALAGFTTLLTNLSQEISALDQSVDGLANKPPSGRPPHSPHHPHPIKHHPGHGHGGQGERDPKRNPRHRGGQGVRDPKKNPPRRAIPRRRKKPAGS